MQPNIGAIGKRGARPAVGHNRLVIIIIILQGIFNKQRIESYR